MSVHKHPLITSNTQPPTGPMGDTTSFIPSDTMADTTPLSSSDTTTIHTSSLYSPRTKSFHQNLSLEISPQTGLITKIHTRDPSEPLPSPLPKSHISLLDYTILPGLVDAHTHIFLHPYAQTPSFYQEVLESPVERILRASNHAKSALLAGYTTYRDLGTEGLGAADVGLRDAINRGIIPGPRLFVATDPLASSGGYETRYESEWSGTRVPRLANQCDGVDGVRAGVRRRLAEGADVVKFYADYRKRARRWPGKNWPGCLDVLHPPGDGGSLGSERNPNLLLFRQDEMDEIVREAKAARCPVAAHACEPEAVVMASNAGVTTVEHGFVKSDEARAAMKKNGTIFVPTLSVIELFKDEVPKEMFENALSNVKSAWEEGVKLACGGDTGPFEHGENVRELELMVKAGVPIMDVLRAATLGGWEACGGDWCGKRFGSLEEGWCADLVAVEGNPEEDIGALRKVKFVMKDGQVLVKDGKITQGPGL